MNEDYYIGLEFIADDDYPNKATWCNQNNCHIEPKGFIDGVRYFVIVANPEPTEEELILTQIDTLKRNLFNTDYQAIKYAEGVLSEEAYLPMKQQREAWRQQINELESRLNLN